jgi:hydroxymethylbilane synthase
VEIRSGDSRVTDALAQIDDPHAAIALTTERAVVARLGGGCQMPIGAYAQVAGEIVSVNGIVVSIDGARAAHAQHAGPIADPAGVGRAVAERLLAGGADDILAEVHRAHAAVEGLQP